MKLWYLFFPKDETLGESLVTIAVFCFIAGLTLTVIGWYL